MNNANDYYRFDNINIFKMNINFDKILKIYDIHNINIKDLGSGVIKSIYIYIYRSIEFYNISMTNSH